MLVTDRMVGEQERSGEPVSCKRDWAATGTYMSLLMFDAEQVMALSVIIAVISVESGRFPCALKVLIAGRCNHEPFPGLSRVAKSDNVDAFPSTITDCVDTN